MDYRLHELMQTAAQSLHVNPTRRRLLRNGFAASILLWTRPSMGAHVLSTSPSQENASILQEIAERYPSPYVNEVIYDPDKSILIGDQQASLERELHNFSFWEENIGHLSNLLGMGSVPDSFLEELRQNEELRTHTAQRVLDIYGLRLEATYDGEYAVTPHAVQGLGNQEKSTIYFFQEAFGPEHIVLNGGGTFTFPEEVRLPVLYWHECFHTEQNHKGIDVDNGITITSSNVQDIIPQVVIYSGESEAYFRTYQRAKEEGTPSQISYSANALMGFMESWSVPMSFMYASENATPLDKSIIMTQMNKYTGLRSEVYGNLPRNN